MADENQGKADGASGAPGNAQSPAGNSGTPAGAGDIQAILAKNDELLAELKRTKGALKKFEDANAAADEAKKKEEGRYTELIADKDKQLNELRSNLREQVLKGLCSTAGINDPDYYLILAHRIEFGADGQPTNAEQVLSDLRTNKSYLFGSSSQQQRPGASHLSPAGFHGGGAGVFTREQIRAMTPEEYAKNADAIKRAAQAGAIK